MVIYEITAVVEPGLVSQYEQYMRERHIPDLLATGYFTGVQLTREVWETVHVWPEGFQTEVQLGD